MVPAARCMGTTRHIITFVAMLATSMSVDAQSYPSKPVRMVAGMAAGGGADVNARRLAQILNKILKQSVIKTSLEAK